MGDRALPHILPDIRNPSLQMAKYLNFLAALDDRRRQALKVRAYPIDVTLDLVTACQLRCPYCAVGNRTIHRRVNRIQDGLFSRIVDEQLGAAFIGWFFSAGEPLLHPKAARLMARLKDKEIFSVISTNLSLCLSDRQIEDLLRSGLGMLSVSLDGTDQRTYSQYRRGGRFDRVWNNLTRLMEGKKRMGLVYPLIEWRFLVFEHNQHEIDIAMQMAREIGVDLFEAFPGYAPADAPAGQVRPANRPITGGLCGPALDLGRQRNATAMQKYLQGRPDPVITAGLKPVGSCDWLYLGTMIYPDGSIAPCCVATDEEDDFTRLDRHADFMDAWNAPIYQRTRRAMRDDRHSKTVCDHCPLPASRYYQFLQRLKAILRNAPDWVLCLVASCPDDFFLPRDRELMPLEFEALTSGRLALDFDRQQVVRKLASIAENVGFKAEWRAKLVDMLER